MNDLDPDRTIAVDIALDPDATMAAHATAVNARLRSQFPAGFELGETHKPHITVLQRFVDRDALDRVAAAARSVIADEDVTAWQLTAVDHNYIAIPPIGVATIAVATTDELLRLQQRLIDALAPYTVPTGTTAAFVSSVGGTDIQDKLISYVAAFVPRSSGEHFHPHVTTGVATVDYLDQMMQEQFEPVEFTVTGATLYQLGTYGTAQKHLDTLT